MTIRLVAAPLSTCVVLGFFVTGCTLVNDLPPEVTCKGVKAIRLGMNEDEVTALVGSPRYRTPGADCRAGDGPRHECWSYEPDGSLFGGIRFHVIMHETGVANVAVYTAYLHNDASTTLYYLSEHGVTQRDELNEHLQCGS